MNEVIVITKGELESIIQDSFRKVLNEQNIDKGITKDCFFSVKETAEFLNLAKQTLYGLTSKREIPFLKKGKKLYFKKSELENWVNQGKRKSVGEIQAELEGGKS